jgi:hypothetical protein
MVSSISDSYDEEEETLEHEQATPRPRLRPFFGSDTLSLVSMPQPGEAEGMMATKDELTIAQPRIRSHSASEVCNSHYSLPYNIINIQYLHNALSF